MPGEHAGEPTETAAVAEGPLSRAARVASERAYVNGMTDRSRVAWARATGAQPELSAKRQLVAISHSIEKAVMSGSFEPPTVVIALFQRLPFFDRERVVYERMAALGIEVVIGFVEQAQHRAPVGVRTVLLRPDEPLADEWTVVAVGPHAGAYLVATDQHTVDEREHHPELSRQFLGRWGFSRTQGASELARLRFALGDRLDADLGHTVDALLARAMPAGGDSAGSSGTAGEMWSTTALYHMFDQMQAAQAGSRELREQLADAHQAAAARTSARVDPESGLPTPDFLSRWSAAAGTTELPVGLALFDVDVLGEHTLLGDDRAAYYAVRQVAAAMTQPLGPVDAVVRLSRREFLVVIPGASVRHLAGVCDRIGEQLDLASWGYPNMSFTATTATMVTSSRPLPLYELQAALGRLPDGNPGPLDAGRTPAGERIIVASTRLYRDEVDEVDGVAGGAALTHHAPGGLDEYGGPADWVDNDRTVFADISPHPGD